MNKLLVLHCAEYSFQHHQVVCCPRLKSPKSRFRVLGEAYLDCILIFVKNEIDVSTNLAKLPMP